MLKVLFLAANPTTSSPLRLGAELREIDAKLMSSAGREGIQLNAAFAARPGDLLQLMNRFRPHVLHISGHGQADGEVVLESDDGKARPISAAALKALFRSFRPELQVVILNACHSAVQAEAFVEIVDAVVAVSGSIRDDTATIFAASFYRALGFGCSVTEAYNQATTAILLEGIDESHKPVLLHSSRSDPSTLTVSSSPARVRLHDPSVPDRLRALLASGTPLIVLPHEAVGSVLFFELALRNSDATYVVEATGRMPVTLAAARLAQQLLGEDALDYDWTLVRRTATNRDQPLRGHITLEMAGIHSGDQVLLVGNHRMPEWAPSYR